MVNGFTDNDDPRWSRSHWQVDCEFNPDARFLAPGQSVYLTYRDPERFKGQRSVSIVGIREAGGEWWADLDGEPFAAPRWALVAAA
ncbi:hypothetical protein ONO86_05625 [Micromonospora noduli]|nr:hypothetical protein ONO86_05625 [Micromonospora noduli]